MGLAAKVVPTKGHPVVLARSAPTSAPKRPCLLFYGHYDVQPVGDQAQWTHAPFDPRKEDGVHRFYGRGASDSKSQLWTFIKALRAWRTIYDGFPADIIVLLEGEEECGSPSLPDFIKAHRQELECDVAFICDTEMWSKTQPAITTLGAECVFVGFILPGDAIHAPDERYDSERLKKGARSWVRILEQIQLDTAIRP